MTLTEGQKNALVAAGAILLGYAGYRILFKKDSAPKAIETAAKAPVEITEKVVETVIAIPKKLIKGSEEAKAHMKKLAHMKKGTGRRAKAKKSKIEKTRVYEYATPEMGKGYIEAKDEEDALAKLKAQNIALHPTIKLSHYDDIGANDRVKRKKYGLLAHKGHATKKGLSQDQKLISSEPHEKQYQKKKAR
jgi:hypothetical protein